MTSLLATPTPAITAVPTRVHRMDAPHEPPAQENSMPRKPKDPAAAPTEPPKRRGRPPGKKRGPKAKTRKDGLPIGAATFAVNDGGALEIRDGQQVINLEAPDVKRLAAFLQRTKGIRA